MKGQADLAPMEGHSDFIRRLPLLTGYKPHGEVMITLSDTHITWASGMDLDYLRELARITTGIRDFYDPERKQTLTVVYFLPLPEADNRRSKVRLLMEALTEGNKVWHAPETCPDVDLSVMVSWEGKSYLTSACLEHEPLPEGHPIEGEVLTLPGMTVHPDRTTWERACEVTREDIVPTPDVLARAEAVSTNLGNHPREMLAELATDPRGLDDAGALALARYIKVGNATEVARSWLANGWSVDNLMRLVRTTSVVPVRTAVATTMAADGYLGYAMSVARSIPSPQRSAFLERILEDSDPIAFMEDRQELVKDLDSYRLWS